MLDFFVYTCLITALLSVLIGSLVFINKRRSKIGVLYLLFCLAVAVWSYALGRVVTSISVSEAIFWNWILYFAVSFIPPLFLWFIICFLKKEKQYLNLVYLGLFIALVFLLVIPSRVFVAGVSAKAGFPYWLDPGPFFYAFPVFFSVYVFLSLFILFRSWQTETGLKKKQISYVFVAYLIGFFGGSTDFLPQLFGWYPFGHFVTSIYVLVIAYAITRYRLLDIKTIIKRSSVFTLLVMVVSVIFVTLSGLLIFYFQKHLGIYAQLVSAFISAIVLVVLYEPIKLFINRLTDRFLYIKSYNPSQVLSEVSTWALSEIDLSKLLELLEARLQNIFYFKKIAFLFLDEKKHLSLVKQSDFDFKQLSQFARGKEKILPWYFTDNKGIKVIYELKAAYEAGEYQPKSLEILYGLFDMDVALVVPLFVKENLIGVILIGDKKSGDSYNQEDINTIGAIAGQLAMAIDNARLYERQRQFNVKLKEEVKKATAKLESANKELQRLDDAKSEFLSIASHQLRTPTTIIKGYISMMQDGSFGKVPKIVKDNLDKVFIATERLLNLIENLLDISRIEAGRLEFNIESVDLTKIADELYEEFRSKAAAKKLRLNTYYPKDLPTVSSDLSKVKEVASNLVDNSIKYTKDGEVSMDLHQEGSSVVFSVVDTGMGIAPEDVGRLFNKFVRGTDMTTTHPEGTGLGLYFARVVIENLGGRIWAESAGKGKGSKFSFSLPLADKKQAKKVSQ